MSLQRYRGDGTTTRQMQESPRNATYIWCNGNLSYPRRLANHIDREDLRIIRPYELYRLKGLEITGLVTDHAARLTETERDECKDALAYTELHRAYLNYG